MKNLIQSLLLAGLVTALTATPIKTINTPPAESHTSHYWQDADEWPGAYRLHDRSLEGVPNIVGTDDGIDEDGRPSLRIEMCTSNQTDCPLHFYGYDPELVWTPEAYSSLNFDLFPGAPVRQFTGRVVYTVTPVPEPAAFVLDGAGLGALAGYVVQRKWPTSSKHRLSTRN